MDESPSRIASRLRSGFVSGVRSRLVSRLPTGLPSGIIPRVSSRLPSRASSLTGERRPASATVAVAALAALAAVVVWVVSTRVFPYHSLNHDEAVYLQQAAMLLEGRLFLTPPVEDVFRPWFFVERDDGLYPKYSPVTAAMYALGKLLGGYRLALPAVAAASVALVAGVAREAFDRRTGVLAAAFLLASPLFLVDSAVFLPYAPTTMLNLAFAYAYLRADRTGDRRWAALAGVAVGLAFFARPFTAVLFAAPFVCHACWTLRTAVRPLLDERTLTASPAVPRQVTTAALGLAGVTLALAYNAVVTGSPWLFPYEAFAPLDGLGFGRRRLLGHEIEYTLDLAVRANRQIVELFATEWVAGGLYGTALAVVGLVAAARRGLDARQAAVAGVAPAVVVGNVYFWGNYNVLGDLDRAGDGLVAALGPYYHFDLLVPTAVLAAVGALGLLRGAWTAVESGLDRRWAHVAVAAVAVVGIVTLGGTVVGDVDDRLSTNREVTETYETAYEPFDGGPPADSLVFVPSPYGEWLNHPFQVLRNDPGYDGRAVYALDDRPFAVADAFPDRRLYRFEYRGPWAPHDGSPDGARLQRVRDVRGSRIDLRATVGVPDGASSVSARVATDDGSRYRVLENVSDAATLDLTVSDGEVRFSGRPSDAGRPNASGRVRPPNASGVATDPLDVAGRETVRATVFVDYGPSGGFSYRFDLPVDAGDGSVRALSPRVERCRGANTCGGAAAHVPALAPDGVFVRTNLTAGERNS